MIEKDLSFKRNLSLFLLSKQNMEQILIEILTFMPV